MIRKTFTSQNKGTALLWSLIIILVLLILAGSMAGLIIKEMRMSTNIDMSEQAYAAARSGVEVGAKACDGETNLSTGDIILDPLSNQVKYNVTIVFSVGPPAICTITSIGKVGMAGSEITRKLSVMQTDRFGSANIVSLPQEVDAPVIVSDKTNLSYFNKSLVPVVFSGTTFYQQFDIDLTNLTVNKTAGSGTIQYVGGVTSKYAVVRFTTSSGGGYSANFDTFGGGTSVAFPGSIPSSTTKVRAKIVYNNGSFKINLKDITPGGTGAPLGCAVTSFSSYSFNNFATYSSDGVVSAKGLTPDSGININSTGAVLENIVLKY